LQSVLRPAVFVPESKSLNSLLTQFREQRIHMAVVVDEYGGISGLVTFEDIIEQIIGDIEDEFDEDESADNIFAVSAERWRINAVTEIEDINQFFGTSYSDEEVDTIGGLVIQEIGHLPVRGEKIIVGPLQFTVARADNRRLH
ncbi:transporter associated domain-containing protein, partial [Neisseria elongata]